MTALGLQLTFPRGERGQTFAVEVRVVDADERLGLPPRQLSWTWADHGAVDRQPRERWVDRLAARLHVARARRQALALNRRGEHAEAQRLLGLVRTRVLEYAGDDPELVALVQELERAVVEFARPIEELSRKKMHASTVHASRSRQDDGSARRN